MRASFIPTCALATFLGVYALAPVSEDTADQKETRLSSSGLSERSSDTPDVSVYYDRCAEARAAGVAPLYRGEAGYRAGLDRDGDGVACEPYRGAR